MDVRQGPHPRRSRRPGGVSLGRARARHARRVPAPLQRRQAFHPPLRHGSRDVQCRARRHERSRGQSRHLSRLLPSGAPGSVMTDLYGLLFQKVLFPAWESRLRRRPTLGHLSRLERTQWCSAEELRDFQDAELQKLLRHAWAHAPHYRRRVEEAGLGPNDVRGVEDLRKLPLLTPEDATTYLQERQSRTSTLSQVRKMTSG